MAGMIIAHKIGNALQGIANQANTSQKNLNELAQSEHVSHDDKVDHALLTNPTTGQAENGFSNSVSSILSKIQGTPASSAGSAVGAGGAAGGA